MALQFALHSFWRKILPGLCSALILSLFTSAFPAHADATYVTFRVGGKGTHVAALNSSGVVTGFYYLTNKPTKSFLRSVDGTITTFSCGPKFDATANAINDSGVIAGTCRNSTRGFVRAADGTMTMFKAAKDATLTIPFGINADGYIAGYFIEGDTSKGFLRDPSGKIEAFTVPGALGSIYGINKNKQIVGVYTSPGGDYHGFLRDPDGTITTIDAPDAVLGTDLAGLNDAGWVTGVSVDAADHFHDFVRSPDGTFTEFDPCQPYPAPSGINNTQQITGQCYQGFVRAADGSVRKFSVPGKPHWYVSPTTINDAGEIAGTAYLPDQHERDSGFLRFPNKKTIRK